MSDLIIPEENEELGGGTNNYQNPIHVIEGNESVLKQSIIMMSKNRQGNNSQDTNHTYVKQALSMSPRKDI